MKDDLISRQAAIEVLRNRWLKTRNYEGIGEDIAEECEIYLKTLPSAQPVRHGKWIFGSTLGHSWMKCSECCVSQDGQTLCFSYCPNCGSKMDGAERKEK